MYSICVVGEKCIARTYVAIISTKSVENKYKVAFSADVGVATQSFTSNTESS